MFPDMEQGARHFWAASPKREWYQHKSVGVRGAAGLVGRRRGVADLPRRLSGAWSSFRRSATSVRSRASSAEKSVDCVTLPTTGVGVATSATRSARLANPTISRVSGAEARTILTLAGRRCRNNSRKMDPSTVPAFSPNNCCKRRSS